MLSCSTLSANKNDSSSHVNSGRKNELQTPKKKKKFIKKSEYDFANLIQLSVVT